MSRSVHGAWQSAAALRVWRVLGEWVLFWVWEGHQLELSRKNAEFDKLLNDRESWQGSIWEDLRFTDFQCFFKVSKS
jgi:hypothetical protein